jgi:hypothetical protein
LAVDTSLSSSLPIVSASCVVSVTAASSTTLMSMLTPSSLNVSAPPMFAVALAGSPSLSVIVAVRVIRSGSVAKIGGSQR